MPAQAWVVVMLPVVTEVKAGQERQPWGQIQADRVRTTLRETLNTVRQIGAKDKQLQGAQQQRKRDDQEHPQSRQRGWYCGSQHGGTNKQTPEAQQEKHLSGP